MKRLSPLGTGKKCVRKVESSGYARNSSKRASLRKVRWYHEETRPYTVIIITVYGRVFLFHYMDKQPIFKKEQALREEEIQAFWEKNDIFEKSIAQDAPNGSFVFYDGPPFGTGAPHYGHLLAGTIDRKSVV